MLEFLEQHLNNFSEEPKAVAQKDYQYLLADKIVESIKNNLDTRKQSCEEEKDLSSEFKISDYYAAISFRKDILQALVPKDILPLLDIKKEHHITVEFQLSDLSIIGKCHLIKLLGVYQDTDGNSALVVSVDGNVY